MDTPLEIIFLVGLAGVAIGLLWLLIVAFIQNWKWGIGIILFPPVGLYFIAKYYRASLFPCLLLFLSVCLVVTPALITRLTPIDLGPYSDVVDGERHLTLTGWDQTDYSVLESETDVVVLQMANGDVTNETLQYLANCAQLRELDISGSAVTNEGLTHLASLPKLEILRVRGCELSDEGFRKHLLEHPTLNRLDARETEISSEVIREWRKADRSRRAM